MACFFPLKGWVSEKSRGITFSPGSARFDRQGHRIPMSVPCGQCGGCRLDHAREWAVRCYHEAQLHEQNCFLTLTFSDDNLNPRNSLVKSDFQNFLKRFRKFIYPARIRYYHCGEYGSEFARPHHHACIFGYDFPDKVLWSEKSGIRLYTSATLDRLWSLPLRSDQILKTQKSFVLPERVIYDNKGWHVPLGYCIIGEVTYESACYVARYVAKKITGDIAPGHYCGREPEYSTMSRGKGIGADFFAKYETDIYPHGFCIVNGVRVPSPGFYDKKYALQNPEKMSIIRRKRSEQYKNNPNNEHERLLIRAEVSAARAKQLRRAYEVDAV